MTRLRHLARIAGALTTLVGAVHVSVGVRLYVWPSFDTLWFHGTGMGLLLAGAPMMLAGAARAWRTLGAVALAANLLSLGRALAFGTLSHWDAPRGPCSSPSSLPARSGACPRSDNPDAAVTDSTPAPIPSTAPRRTPRSALGWADSAGALGAVFAALCCMGAPIIVGVLGAVGLSWLRQDAILWPLMFLSLGVALWGLARDWRRHDTAGPLVLAAGGAVALVAGVVFVHGLPARLLIYGGALALVVATGWNIVARRAPVGRHVSA